MRRRLLLVLACLAGSLRACTDYGESAPAKPIDDAGASSTDAGTTGSDAGADAGADAGGDAGGDAGDSGAEGGVGAATPTGLDVATSSSATCATVQYGSEKKVTYCWGAEGAKYPAASRGTAEGDPSVDGFYRPRLPSSDAKYLTFEPLVGAGTGEWFIGRGTDGQTTATYAWGSNDTGECAAGSITATMPNLFKAGGIALQFDAVHAAPNHGCLVQNGTLYCWGSNTSCELRSGALASCNTSPPVLTDGVARTVEAESGQPSGATGPIIRVAGGLDHTCVQVKGAAADEIRCWGSNVQGQVDSGAGTFIDAPTTVVTVPRAGAGLAAGENHTCAITDVNKVACWGRNDAGQSNPANPSAKSKPVEIATISGSVSTLRAAGDMSCVVARAVGQPSRAYCWGNGPKGRAADDANTAVGKVAGIQDVTQLALGRGHACAVAKKDGAAETDPARVWCWGTNAFKRVDPRALDTQTMAQPVEIQFPPEPAN